MAWIPKKNGFQSMKDALSKAVDNISDKATAFDLDEMTGSIKGKISSAKDDLSENISSFDLSEIESETKNNLISTATNARDTVTSAYSATIERSASIYEEISIKVQSVDYSDFGQVEYYRETFSRYKNLSASKVVEYAANSLISLVNRLQPMDP